MTSSGPSSNIHIMTHPLIQHKLNLMRMKETDSILFRRLLNEISLLMGYEVTRDLPLAAQRIETPLAQMDAFFVSESKIAIVPILRAGLGMTEGLLDLMPRALVGHIGLYRDPVTKMPVEYLVKLPDPNQRLFILVDPMLATGNSAVHAVRVLLSHHVQRTKIRFLSLVAAPEGVEVFQKEFPDIPLYTAALDQGLTEKAYITPGLGDAGDRIFGTK